MVYIVLHYFILEFMHSEREDDAPGQIHIDNYADLCMASNETIELTTMVKEIYVKE